MGQWLGQMIEITKLPIIIYSNYRTGSTALSNTLARTKNNLINFIEPHANPQPIRPYSQLIDFVKNKESNFIVKFMPDQVPLNPVYQTLLDEDNFKIRLMRRNKVNQIASHYIAEQTRQFSIPLGNVVDDYSVNIDIPQILISMDILGNNDKILIESTLQFDLNLYYEDLQFDSSYTLSIPTKQPKNYNEICDTIRLLLEKKK